LRLGWTKLSILGVSCNYHVLVFEYNNVIRPNYNVKDKPKKIIMSNSQPIKVISDKIEKINLKNDKKI
jgi:hypothetical protein